MNSELDPVALALELRDAELGRGPTVLFTERFPGFTWDDARAVARARDELRVADGDVLVGYKLGWTSAVMRESLGIDRPNWGTLWASQLADSTVDAGRFRQAKVEPELVYRCGEWALGVEFVDPRFPSFDFEWLDNTADNSSAAAVRVGEFGPVDGDLASVEVAFADGRERHAGVGANAMGSPIRAVQWLERSLAAEGAALRDEDLVFTGGLTPPFDVEPARTYRLTGVGLEHAFVEVTVA